MGFRGSQIQKSVQAVKRMDRLAPNLAHMIVQIHLGMDIRQTNCPSRHLGFLGGSNIQKVWRSCQTAGPIGTNFGSRLRIHLGIDIG